MNDTPGASPIARLLDLLGARTRHAVPLLGVAVLGSALALGGAPAWTVPVAALAAALAAVLTGVDPRLTRDVVARAWLALTVVLAIQLLPLPPGLLRLIDARGADVSARALLGFGVDRASSWRPLHVDPGSGLSDFVMLLGLGAAYVSARAVSMRDGLERLLALCAAAALSVALIALAHLLTGQDKLYAVYQPRLATPPILSPLLNPNHLAALTGAGAILWMGWAADGTRAVRRLLASGAALACGAVCALSLSRGGVAAAAGGVVLFVALLSRGTGAPEHRERVRGATGRTLIGFVAGAAVVAGGLWLAASDLSREYVEGDASKLDNFRRALSLLRGHELLGVGSGGVPVAVALSQRLDPDFTFARVESLPIDLALGFGLPAAAFALYAAGRALRRWFVPFDAPASSLAAWCALASLLAHDLADFALFLGATGYFAACLAGLLAGHFARRWQQPLPRLKRVARWPALAVLALVAALAPTARRSPLEAERDRVQATLAANPRAWNDPGVRAALARHPGDAYLQLLVGAYAVTRGDRGALRFVNRAMELSPGWSQPHVVLARLFAARGLRGQALVEVREALRRSPRAVVATSVLVARLDPPPTGEELDHITPPGEAGITFLDRVAYLWQNTGRPDGPVAALDALMLRRAPGAVPALRRRFVQARAARDLDAMAELSRRALSHHPELPDGYLFDAWRAEAAGDTDAALRALERGAEHARDRYPLLEERAILLAGLHRPGPMRAVIAQLIDAAGADIDRLVRAHGLHGRLETRLGNLRGALEAYQLAHALTVPEQPYLLQVAEVYTALRDRAGLAAACSQLLEGPSPSAQARALCERGGAQGIIPRAVDVAADGGAP